MHALERVGLESSEKVQKGGFGGFSVKKDIIPENEKGGLWLISIKGVFIKRVG